MTDSSASVEARLKSALLSDEILPPVDPPGGHYLPFSVAGSLCYLSGYISRSAPNEFIRGKVTDGSVGAAAARTCALGHLALLKERCGGLSNVKSFHKVTVYVNGDSGFPDSPEVGNGYTDLIVEVFGEAVGQHARSAVTVAGLPFDASVEVEAIVELTDPSIAKRM
mmetsp:Transcript_32956/g.71317  ORF Transcript_32956/g.71317 Transcript_32956/m.71317 type:complete len:167 (+) Transcript_32956:62-562(+)